MSTATHDQTPDSKKSFNYKQLFFIIFGGIILIFLISVLIPPPSPWLSSITEVYDQEHSLITTYSRQNRRPIPLNEIPAFLQQAFISVEDHRFYKHFGINPSRIAKAGLTNLMHRRVEEGGSTITQQLAKNAYLSQERTFMRKLKELFYAIKLETHYSKEKILELYLNQIYFGHSAYGIKVAAMTYFGKNMDQLNQAEMALLAGLPRGPAFYSPYTHPQKAQERLERVLNRMLTCEFITAEQYETYRKQKLTLPGIQNRITRPAPYFLSLMQDELAKIFPDSPGIIYQGGLKIETTLNTKVQTAAENTLSQGLPKLLRDKYGLTQPQGALIAINPSNGAIQALVGGTNFNLSPFNRATQAKRQPGSSFKPILYASAFDRGYTLASVFDRTPQTYQIGKQIYRPLDHNDEFTSGMLSLREALACSSNVISVKLLDQLGSEPVLNFAHKLGITSTLPSQLSLALGSGEVTPLELISAYVPLANGGVKHPPYTIKRILDHRNRVIYSAVPKGEQVLDKGISFLITQAMTGVLKLGGTAAQAGSLLGRPAAGKTGTTENNRDAWFVGYTPDLVAGVYVGCDKNQRYLPGAASQIAAPIWVKFINQALQGQAPRDFIIPDSVISTTVCKETGQRATTYCPSTSEFFLKGTEPKEFCQKHQFYELKVCTRSGLLPGPNCRRTKLQRFDPGTQPTETCDRCGKPNRIIRWFDGLFNKRQRQRNNEIRNQDSEQFEDLESDQLEERNIKRQNRIKKKLDQLYDDLDTELNL